MESVNEIRKTFLQYFLKEGHEVVPSSSLIPHNDPTLMFTNSGMVQFKNVFTGNETRQYSRAVTSQKCVRAGGKHNDLENVGHTVRHHTFFEMLGNFSFGDYFKKEAIEFAWKLIVTELGLPKEKLLVTVHTSDEEAAILWKKIAGLPDKKIIKISTSDNFWSMGDTGPCGPCSEIFYDHGEKIEGGPPGSAGENGDRFIEIWNLVFMQFEQITSDQRIELPKPSIDTGMGLERIAAVLQGTNDNYQIDTMQALILASKEESALIKGRVGTEEVSHKVIADHSRAVAFLIADGVVPSNEGRGYVLRRIMRRAMRHAHLIGCEEPLIWRLVPTLVSQMGQAFPELSQAQELISETLRLEETRFKKLLDRGLKLLDDATVGMSEGEELDGETAFKLYDTYGFPLDLTQDALRVRNIFVNTKEFDQAMSVAQSKARANWKGSGDSGMHKIWFDVREMVEPTEFLGYQTEKAEVRIVSLVVNNTNVQTAKEGDDVAIIANQTPFYGESGGQVGDRGAVTTSGGAIIKINDTQVYFDEITIHIGRVEVGEIKLSDQAVMAVDRNRRAALRSNHSGTHLMHAALRERLGQHVVQKGSLVDENRMRFDISHPKPISLDELQQVEFDVNTQIRLNSEVVTRIMDPNSATKAGALALFGEKYGDQVRVVSMGIKDDGYYSTELCGGTHVARTGDIGWFKIISEGAVGAGIRRLEVLTGKAAEEHVCSMNDILVQTAGELKVKLSDIPERIRSLLEERKELEHTLTQFRKRIATSGSSSNNIGEKNVGNILFVPKILEGLPAKELKGLADDIKKQIGSGVIALISNFHGKASLVVGVTEDLTDRISAVDLVCEAAGALGGKGGGGRSDMAQAGGPDGSGGQTALNIIEERLAKF
ncbi:MAG: Alanine--tRNA ligase [Alphaproteobacteria bacterium MarineAlpha3_Bin5]|nr:alanine--tRNA ligase [Magnetovibrio sp.]PPR80082.1 MAG: Alanine--tRNA ligase [Alphaproteobacteria bacterium MarineAlpha3_Bin5]